MILEHALPPVKPGPEADFEQAVAKAKAGWVLVWHASSVRAWSDPGHRSGTDFPAQSGRARPHGSRAQPARRQVPVPAGD